MGTFKKAERRQVRPKLALTGPSGSGKTFSALLLAAGMGKKIAVIDTENGSASLYADMDKGPLKGVKFDVLEIDPPYTIDKYARAIEAAQSEGYDVLVADSLSHAWAGEGGLLSKKEALDQRGGNSYTNWAGITKEHELFKARILTADIILICTMRSKQDYVLEINDKGKQAPKKVGMAPIQRDGLEYEFTTVFDLAMDHNAAVSKDRTAMFDGQIFKITKKTGEQIIAWLNGAKPIEQVKDAARPASAPAAQPAKAEPSDAEAYPDGPPEPAETKAVRATAAQKQQISDGVKVMVGLGFQADKVWGGIEKELYKKYSLVLVDSDSLDNLQAETAIDYLKRWAGHVKQTRAAAAAKHTAEDHAGEGA
jgi:hypothetical protein